MLTSGQLKNVDFFRFSLPRFCSSRPPFAYQLAGNSNAASSRLRGEGGVGGRVGEITIRVGKGIRLRRSLHSMMTMVVLLWFFLELGAFDCAMDESRLE